MMTRARLAGAVFAALASVTASATHARDQAAAPISAVAAAVAQQPQGFVERFQAPQFDPRWTISDGWHSGEWFSSAWRRDQVSLAQQGLVIALDRAPGGGEKPYVSGEISTTDEFLYGYFEARLRMPRGRGLVSAFFTFTRPEGVESWNEIDMELTGYDPHRIELVYHVAGQATLQVEELPFDASEDYHTYAFEWRRNSIRWYVDNELVHVSRRGRVAELTRPQRIFSSLWNSERMPRWLGVIDPNEAPWRMHVACMAYAPHYEGRSLCVD